MIAIDAMGGDKAPRMVLQGANIARARHPQVHYALFGDEKLLRPLLARLPKLAGVATVHHTDD
ncbi:MAG: hypothetical protein ACREB3_07750, partial [Burkholderiales bacterium]